MRHTMHSQWQRNGKRCETIIVCNNNNNKNKRHNRNNILLSKIARNPMPLLVSFSFYTLHKLHFHSLVTIIFFFPVFDCASAFKVESRHAENLVFDEIDVDDVCLMITMLVMLVCVSVCGCVYSSSNIWLWFLFFALWSAEYNINNNSKIVCTGCTNTLYPLYKVYILKIAAFYCSAHICIEYRTIAVIRLKSI